jgi:hypothetical protein
LVRIDPRWLHKLLTVLKKDGPVTVAPQEKSQEFQIKFLQPNPSQNTRPPRQKAGWPVRSRRCCGECDVLPSILSSFSAYSQSLSHLACAAHTLVSYLALAAA